MKRNLGQNLVGIDLEIIDNLIINNHNKDKNVYNILKKSGIFDETWYLKRYPDVAESKIDPLYHYVYFGAYEEREPVSWLKIKEFIIENKEIKLKKINPLYYYLKINYIDNIKVKIKNGFSKYSVVVSCFNVEKYLEKFFYSLLHQKLSFQNNIFLIMVDDGSTDSTSKIIKFWQEKYPNNIKYFYKKNGGLSSARNFGLKHVETEWVTFCDPDDFIAPDYFYQVDSYICSNITKNIGLVSTKVIYYIESANKFNDNHPLNYRYTKNEIIKVEELKNYIVTSVACSFFLTKKIKNNTLYFPEQVSTYEDAFFVYSYLHKCPFSSILFLKDAEYYYRKRADKNSYSDTAWKGKSFFLDCFIYIYIPIMELYKKDTGSIPSYVQYAVFYMLLWYLKGIIERPNTIAHLNESEKEKFKDLLHQSYSYIDKDIILNYKSPEYWYEYKIGILSYFKNECIDTEIKIREYDSAKKEILISYFTGKIFFEKILINDIDTIPTCIKNRKIDLCGETFLLERFLWIPIENETFKLNIIIKGFPAKISISKNLLSILTYQDNYFSIIKQEQTETQFTNSWIFIDRDTQADDNAEHLYNYIKNKYPNENIYFVLRKNSHDWARLKKEGFKLLKFGSLTHEKALKECSHIISSHADEYIHDYFKDGSLDTKKYIFLQHGVTIDDISSWINNKHINMIITVNKMEYNAIASDFSNFSYSNKEVVLTGFPRHDKLFDFKKTNLKKTICIMPTWRRYIVGDVIRGNERARNPSFLETEYAKTWQSLLCNKKLEELHYNFGYSIIFFPHANIQLYCDDFFIPNYITLLKHTNGSIQELFQESSLMITDYSSVGFEMAFLKKPIIYYQFDEKTFFLSHWGHGYFDFRKNGFGPVVSTEEDLIKSLEHIIAQNFKADEIYLKRMTNAFEYNDNNSCERVYRAIKNLDSPNPNKEEFQKNVFRFAKKALISGYWKTAEQRFKNFLNFDIKNHQLFCILSLIITLREQGKFYEAKKYFEFYFGTFFSQKTSWNDNIYRAAYQLEFYRGDLIQSEKYLQNISKKNVSDIIYYSILLSKLNKSNKLIQIIKSDSFSKLEKTYKNFIVACFTNANGKKNRALDILYKYLEKQKQFHYNISPEFFISNILIELEDFDKAKILLEYYRQKTKYKIIYTFEIMHILGKQQKYDNLIKDIEKNKFEVIDLPLYISTHYIIFLIQKGEIDTAINLFSELKQRYEQDFHLNIIEAEIALYFGNTTLSLKLLLSIHPLTKDILYKILHIYLASGEIEKAYNFVSKYEKHLKGDKNITLLKIKLSILYNSHYKVNNKLSSLVKHFPLDQMDIVYYLLYHIKKNQNIFQIQKNKEIKEEKAMNLPFIDLL